MSAPSVNLNMTLSYVVEAPEEHNAIWTSSRNPRVRYCTWIGATPDMRTGLNRYERGDELRVGGGSKAGMS